MNESDKVILNIYSLSTITSGTTGASITAAQKLAVDRINSDNSILSKYKLQLTPIDVEGSRTNTLLHALDITINNNNNNNNNNNTYTNIPIILGCPWSSLSVITAPLLNAYNWGQISSTATSKALSDIRLYPTFYRTVPSDSIQARGLINLCLKFNWKSIGIIHVNDNYGVYLTIGILQIALNENIDANAVAFEPRDYSSILNAVNQMKNINVYIIIIISHGVDFPKIFTILEDEELFGYPYFYIGVDSLMDKNEIIKHNISKYTQGIIGTVRWQPIDIGLEFHDEEMFKVAVNIYSEIKALWNYTYSNDPNKVYNISNIGTAVIYGWDSLYTLALTMNIFDDEWDDGNITGLMRYISGEFDNQFVMGIFDNIIRNELNFLSASGNVTFDINGDRDEGMYGYGNILKNGDIEYFGYLYKDNIVADLDLIVWPTDFVERDMIPRSEALIYYKLRVINGNILIFILVITFVSIIIICLTMTFTVYYRRKIGLNYINIIVCIGCLMLHLIIILDGFNYGNSLLLSSFICNLNVWILTISTTLVLMPLFLEIYRLSKIFTQILVVTNMTDLDLKLFYRVLCCIGIDLIILIIFTSIKTHKVNIFDANIEIIDELQKIQYQYISCNIDDNNDNSLKYSFFIIIGLWKLSELVFGIYCYFIVSRIGFKQIRKFDATSSQLLSILIIIIILCILIPLFIFGPINDINFRYILQSIAILIICNILIFINIIPPIFAILKNNQNKYKISDEEKLKSMLKEQFQKLTQQDWYNEDYNQNNTQQTETEVNQKSTITPFNISKDNQQND